MATRRRVELDPLFPLHPKVIAAGPLAGWLHLGGLCYSTLHLTDGLIPADRLTGLQPNLTGYEQLAETLTAVGLWHQTEDGYEIHDFADYQVTTAKLARRREQSRLRQLRFRSRDVTRRNAAVTRDTDDLYTGATQGFSALDLEGFAIGSELPVTQDEGQGPLTAQSVSELLAGADSQTPLVIGRVLKRYGLPAEWALARALESVEQRRGKTPALVSEARYFVASLVSMGENGVAS